MLFGLVWGPRLSSNCGGLLVISCFQLPTSHPTPVYFVDILREFVLTFVSVFAVVFEASFCLRFRIASGGAPANLDFSVKSFSRASCHCSVVVVVAKWSVGALSSCRESGRVRVAVGRCILGLCGRGLRGESDSRRYGEGVCQGPRAWE